MPPAPADLAGFLIVDKPAGWTSHDVVARVRRLLGLRQVGHAGTLDPAATGVLPLAVGAATKVLEYLAEASKTYLAEVTFGVATDSHDADGRLTALADPSGLEAAAVEAALAAWRGPVLQLPPMQAAIKVGGRRLYEAARRGEEVARQPRPVVIHTLELLAWAPPVATLLIDCAKGTYVRALARDLGEALGVGAHLSSLVRLRTGPFHLCEAWTLAELAELDPGAAWPWIAIHPDAVLAERPALLLGPAEAARWRNGTRLAAAGDAKGIVRVYGPDGDWLGVGRGDGATWRPLKVVPAAGNADRRAASGMAG